MPNINETSAAARRVLPIIYVLDTSGSMSGARIACLNEAMTEALALLSEVSSHNPDAEIKVGVLRFSTRAQWVTDGLLPLKDAFWSNLEADGLTQVSAALTELDEKLSSKGFLVSDTGFYAPVLIFLSDGAPSDPELWESKLEQLKQRNSWFRHATKLAIALGEDADSYALAKLTGNAEAVVSVNDTDALIPLIKAASATAAMISSQSRTTADGDKAQDIVSQVKDLLHRPETIQYTAAPSAAASDLWDDWDASPAEDSADCLKLYDGAVASWDDNAWN